MKGFRIQSLNMGNIRCAFQDHFCMECLKRGGKTNEIHHINGDRADNRISNLRVLCKKCHAETHARLRRGIVNVHEAKRFKATRGQVTLDDLVTELSDLKQRASGE